jgi:subtilisin family serine protease
MRGNGTDESGARAQHLPLQGAGQIVGCSDTGIDYDHCFFRDKAHPMLFDQINPAHRKIVFYRTTLADSSDAVDGHGTHITGSLAGSCDIPGSPIGQWNGTAPLAKIAFVDLGNGSQARERSHGGTVCHARRRPTEWGGGGGPWMQDLVYPTDLGVDIYQFTYTAGAFIQSDSWGGEPQGFGTSMTLQIDKFIQTHKARTHAHASIRNGIWKCNGEKMAFVCVCVCAIVGFLDHSVVG